MPEALTSAHQLLNAMQYTPYQHQQQQQPRPNYYPRGYYAAPSYGYYTQPPPSAHMQQGYRPPMHQQSRPPRPHYQQHRPMTQPGNPYYYAPPPGAYYMPPGAVGYNRPPLHAPGTDGFYAPAPEAQAANPASPFQQPAPAIASTARPVLAPSVPANGSSFTAAAVVRPSASGPIKIKIVDPNTGKEIYLGARQVVAEKPLAKPVEAAQEARPVLAEAPVAPVAPTAPVVAASIPAPPAVPGLLAKKVSIVIKDPNSNKELDLNEVISRPVAAPSDLALDELAESLAVSARISDDDEEDHCSPRKDSIDAAEAMFNEHSTQILAGLHVEDDELSSDYSDDDDNEDEDYLDDDEEDEECVFIPSTVQYAQSISYPAGLVPFEAPLDATGVWRYSRDFMLQFQDKCRTTPGDLQDRLSAAVERAKAFVRADRAATAAAAHRGDRRGEGGRREGGRRDGGERRKRHHPGLVGPQAHLLDPNAELKNRADNAWQPVTSSKELAESDRILREVKGLLNKLTLDKFHVISDKILSLGILSDPDILAGVIACVFDKAVDEPRFAPMYAELCYKIVVEELNGLKKSLPDGVGPDSQFRRLLVERCQAEYKHKRAWSKQRLERLIGKKADEDACTDIPECTPAVKKAEVGELTEEDYLMIKLKRRVLGNMRFIGEIFKVGLIGEKIMHSIIAELLSNVENPEEEEIECLCRLLMTVGAILDKPEAANFWNQYVARMQWLVSQPGKLSSRIRFMVMDVLELRDKRWSTKGDEGPKTINQILKEQRDKERDQRDRNRDRDRDRDRDREHRDRRSGSASGSAVKFSSSARSGAGSTPSEWSQSGPARPPSSGPSSTSSNAPLSRSKSVRTPVLGAVSSASLETSPIATAALNSPTNRFNLLVTDSAPPAATLAPSVSDSDRVRKVVSLFDEYVQMNNLADVMEEMKLIAAEDKRCEALAKLIGKAVESGRRASVEAVNRIVTSATSSSISSREAVINSFKQVFGTIDDVAVDVPAVFEFAGLVFANQHLSGSEIQSVLHDCSDVMARGRTLIFTMVAVSDVELRKTLASDTIMKEWFTAAKAKSAPTIQTLLTRLQLDEASF